MRGGGASRTPLKRTAAGGAPAFAFGAPRTYKTPQGTAAYAFGPSPASAARGAGTSIAGTPSPAAGTAAERAAIESALSLLESVPAPSLAGFAGRLESLARAVRAVNASGGTSRSREVFREVLEDDHLLGHILGYEGSLAHYHKFYGAVVGYENPLPHETPPFPVKNTNLLVCKRWKSLVAGDAGYSRWKSDSAEEVSEEISIARNAAEDETLSWTARMCAQAIANDADALRSAFRNPNDRSRGIGAALKEQRRSGFEPVKRGHPFRYYCMWDLVEIDWFSDGEDNENDSSYENDDVKGEFLFRFTTSIAYAAALVGSLNALRFIQSLDPNDYLWNRYFNEKGTMFLGLLVRQACANPTLNCIVASVSAILAWPSRPMASSELHSRHRGANGNHLHLAAARGHAALVKVLIEGGMCPNRPCERITPRYRCHDGYYDDYYDDSDTEGSDECCDPRDRGVSEHPLPIHWASIRGHVNVVDLIRSLNGDDDRVRERGRVKCFNNDRGFGFIKRKKDGEDVFVHISNIEDDEPLREGESVEFVVGETTRGLQALEVSREGWC